MSYCTDTSSESPVGKPDSPSSSSIASCSPSPSYEGKRLAKLHHEISTKARRYRGEFNGLSIAQQKFIYKVTQIIIYFTYCI
jgi:hypothetical protein